MRLSFSDRLSGKCSSTLRIPTQPAAMSTPG
jgi:hypothetical protein